MEVLKRFVKALIIMQHYVCAAYGISRNTHGSEIQELGDNRKGKSISRAIY